MINEISREIKQEWVNDQLRVTEKAVYDLMKVDVIGIKLSREFELANLYGKINNDLNNINKAKKQVEKTIEDLERIKDDYAKALDKIGKEAVIPQLDPNKPKTKKEINEQHVKAVQMQNQMKEQFHRIAKETRELINWLEEKYK